MSEQNMNEQAAVNEELKCIIEQSVDESVERAFRNYGKKEVFSGFGLGKSLRILLTGLCIIIIGLCITLGITIRDSFIQRRNASEKVQPVENHELILENNKIFGFTAADFEEVILGEATRQKLLIVEEQEVYVNTTITDTGLFDWGVFNKEQALTIHGMGKYTIDLTQITSKDIQLNEKTYELTIQIPHAVLHNTNFDPEKTEISDTKKGWLAFGDIKLNQEQQAYCKISITGV